MDVLASSWESRSTGLQLGRVGCLYHSGPAQREAGPDDRQPRPRPRCQCLGGTKPPGRGPSPHRACCSVTATTGGRSSDRWRQPAGFGVLFLPGRLDLGDGLPTPLAGELVPQAQVPQGVRRRHTSATVSACYCACNTAVVSTAADDRGRVCHEGSRFWSSDD